MKISIIIAVKGLNDFLKECIQKCQKLTFKDYEIIVLPDEIFEHSWEGVKVVATGACFPAKKRDIGATHASGEILAFLDDDAYPAEHWLDSAVVDFEDKEVAAVGGPAITPPTEDFLRQASGLVYESFAVSGNFRYRYVKDKKRFVDDYPSCNLLVRKDMFQQIGGFNTKLWPGEDTILCLEITKNLGKKIVYDPDVLVFHHRRPLFGQHLKQVLNYGLHRGYFVKRFPQTSLKWQYFVPSTFLIWLIFGFFVSLSDIFMFLIYALSLLIYGTFVVFSAWQEDNKKMIIFVALGIFLTHLYYGFYFILGLLQDKLKEESLEGV